MQVRSQEEFDQAKRFRVEMFSGNLWLDGRSVEIGGELIWRDLDGYPIDFNDEFWRDGHPLEDSVVRCLTCSSREIFDADCSGSRFAVCEYRHSSSEGKSLSIA